MVASPVGLIFERVELDIRLFRSVKMVIPVLIHVLSTYRLYVRSNLELGGDREQHLYFAFTLFIFVVVKRSPAHDAWQK